MRIERALDHCISILGFHGNCENMADESVDDESPVFVFWRRTIRTLGPRQRSFEVLSTYCHDLSHHEERTLYTDEHGLSIAAPKSIPQGALQRVF